METSNSRVKIGSLPKSRACPKNRVFRPTRLTSEIDTNLTQINPWALENLYFFVSISSGLLAIETSYKKSDLLRANIFFLYIKLLLISVLIMLKTISEGFFLFLMKKT